jgi:purine-cytosine permease-like protein
MKLNWIKFSGEWDSYTPLSNKTAENWPKEWSIIWFGSAFGIISTCVGGFGLNCSLSSRRISTLFSKK